MQAFCCDFNATIKHCVWYGFRGWQYAANCRIITDLESLNLLVDSAQEGCGWDAATFFFLVPEATTFFFFFWIGDAMDGSLSPVSSA